MRLNIKTHRRNKAVQQFDQCLRLSFATAQTQHSPSSLRKSLQASENFKNSDLSCLSKRKLDAKKQQTNVKNMVLRQTQSKNASSFKQSLNFLSQKLLNAKAMLQHQSFKCQKPKATQFFSLQRELKVVESSHTSKRQDKNEQSTLNLESRKLLKNGVDCKQKIVWANSLKNYYIGPVVRGMVGINDRAFEHLYQSHHFFSQSNNFVPPKTFAPLNLSCQPSDRLKKVLVIDLDETLVHCKMEFTANCEIEVDLGEEEKGFILIRPYALSFLKKMSKIYEIVVFTASAQDYADSILNQLDPQGLIKHRLYRGHCFKIDENLFTKDLRIINRDLSQMVLVDNSAASFLCQPENGVPILPFLGGEDWELLELQKYLELLYNEEDVRNFNRKTFKLERYSYFDDCQELAAELYEQPANYY